ncbi:hypothetical protein [Dactylosporangium sp. CA-233914]|uniref:hypothetical protein n=1 Tax=Dactylosporangium sp. CA-233914 TaxID=3239934 RepID=UPI003D9054F6
MRRFLPVSGLLLLAPLVGEYLLGNLSVRVLPALMFLVPMYGGGALLIREIVRRTGRGFPAILLLGAAYGVIEAGLVDQSMFNPSFEGHDFQAVTPVPALGLSAANTLSFVAGHAIWSITVPIALVEHLSPGDPRRPWLGRPGLAVTALLYLFGSWIIYAEIRDSEHFVAGPAQRIGTAAAALLLIALAFLARRRRRPAWPAPGVWLTGVIAFVAGSVFFARPQSWAGFWFGIAWLAAGAVWLAGTRLEQRHVMALAAGALLTYAWGGFALTALLEPGDPVRWWGNAGFAAGAVALVAAGALRRGAPTSPGPASAGSSSG